MKWYNKMKWYNLPGMGLLRRIGMAIQYRRVRDDFSTVKGFAEFIDDVEARSTRSKNRDR